MSMNPSADIPDEIQNAIETFPIEMRQAIEGFTRHTGDIVKSFLQKITEIPLPPKIFHYTDDVGLRGILETGTLRLTDIFYLNDPSELRHGCKLDEFMTVAEAAGAEERPAIVEFAGKLAGRLQHDIPRVANMFVLSFSEAGDDLAQWRAYADNGRGYALGFDARMLEDAFGKSGQGCSSFPVSYCESELRHMRQQIIDAVRPLITLHRGKAMTPDAQKKYLETLLTVCGWQVMRVAVFFKHHAYTNEQEYRFQESFMRGTVLDIKYRTRPYTLIRYKEFDWRSAVPDSLKKIVVGPASADSDKARQFAEDCLRRYHVGAVKISCSPIPYRAV
jgi:Protein of unknown function (DUF2971)